MKNGNRLLLAALLLPLLCACQKGDERILTVINPDGTCLREISYHASPQALMAPPDQPYDSECLHFKTDWERTWSLPGEDSLRRQLPVTEAQWDSLRPVYPGQHVQDVIMMHARRQYQSVEEMADSLTEVIGKPFKATARLEKHFKWFYTDYAYEEVFSCTDKTKDFPIPLDRFVGADTAAYWFTGQPDLSRGLTGSEQKEMLDRIEEQISQWMSANSFSYVCRILAGHYNEVSNPPVSKEEFLRLSDTIALSPAVRNAELLLDTERVGTILRDYYHSDAYTPLLQDEKRMQRALEHLTRGYKILTMIAFDYDLVMPGRPLDAGNGELREGGIISYRFSGERLIPKDYVIRATSRVTNLWAFIVTALLLFLAVGSFLWPYYRK